MLIKAVFKILILALASFVLIHIVSVFGVFIALAYPIWSIIAPDYTPVLIGRGSLEGSKKTVKSVAVNTFLILGVTAASVGIVFLENKLIFKLTLASPPKTAGFVVPSKGQYKIGEIFPMEIKVEVPEVEINAVQADIKFDPSIVEVVDVSTKDSFASIFVNKEIENDLGFARLSGGVPNTAPLKHGGLFGTIYLRGKMAGVVKVDFLPSSLILANDGKGTNILKGLAAATFLILPESLPVEAQKQQQGKLVSEIEEGVADKLLFFEKSDIALGPVSSQVLGDSIEDKPEDTGFVELIKKIDSAILDFWRVTY